MSRSLVDESEFAEPPWESPLDTALVLRSVPEDGRIAGMFSQAVLEALKQGGQPSPAPRERYLPFGFYPQREHVKLVIDAARLLFPGKSTRAALRSLGRGAPTALLQTTLGRVSLGSAQSAEQAVRALVNTYPSNVRPSESSIVSVSDTHALVTLRGIHFFLDSHHVGVLEGTLRYAGVHGRVRIRTREAGCADLLCTWS